MRKLFGSKARCCRLVSLPALAALLLAACATNGGAGAGQSPRLANVEEYGALAAKARKLVLASLNSLGQVGAQSNQCSAKLLAAFAHQVQQLEIESIPIRERAQAIRARGDAYFADWSDNIARISDPQVREFAAHSRPELEQCFARIKADSQLTSEAFRPFLQGLRDLRVKLENNPGLFQTGSARDAQRATREHGEEVIRHLDAVTTQLQVITSLVTPTRQVSRQALK